MMLIDTLPEFDKDLKRLLKKYKTLASDLEDVKKILKIRPNQRPPFSVEINNLGIETCIIKVKKIACDALKGRCVNSGLRLVHAYFPNEQKPSSLNCIIRATRKMKTGNEFGEF